MVKEAKPIYDGLKSGTMYGFPRDHRYSFLDIQFIVNSENLGRVGTQVDLYSKQIQATNMGEAKLIVYPDQSGIFFKEESPLSDRFILKSLVQNVSGPIASAKESGKINIAYQYTNSTGNLVGGRRRRSRIQRHSQRRLSHRK